jgi:hypothetical protein
MLLVRICSLSTIHVVQKQHSCLFFFIKDTNGTSKRKALEERGNQCAPAVLPAVFFNNRNAGMNSAVFIASIR